MAGETFTSNMALVLPGVGVTAGPQYATDLNASLSIIDVHDHSSGKGVPVTPSGLSITSDLSVLSNNITNIRSARFTSQVSPIAGVSDLNCAFVVGVDLYYNDGNGNHIRMTQGGSIAGTTGSISGLVAPASASYSPAQSTFTWQSAANTSAGMDSGPLTVRNIAAASFGVTISAPSALAANYSITLPLVLPSANAFLMVTNSGVGSFKSPNVTIYDAVVGSAAQVTGGIATHSSITSALAAVAANGIIKVLPGAYTENVSITQSVNILGSGYGTAVTGNVSIASANYCMVRDINFSGNVTVTGTATGNQMQGVFLGSSSTFSDTNTVDGNGNFYQFIKG